MPSPAFTTELLSTTYTAPWLVSDPVHPWATVVVLVLPVAVAAPVTMTARPDDVVAGGAVVGGDRRRGPRRPDPADLVDARVVRRRVARRRVETGVGHGHPGVDDVALECDHHRVATGRGALLDADDRQVPGGDRVAGGDAGGARRGVGGGAVVRGDGILRGDDRRGELDERDAPDARDGLDGRTVRRPVPDGVVAAGVGERATVVHHGRRLGGRGARVGRRLLHGRLRRGPRSQWRPR